MSSSDNPSPDEFLQQEDIAVLESLQSGSQWLRAVLSTLARRGIDFRQKHPTRAKLILDALSTSPFYKSGQFLFDLLEMEDFMLDGPPPEIIPTTLDAATLARLALLFNTIKGHLDGAAEPLSLDNIKLQLVPGAASQENLPPFEAGFYLYQDVVLGLVRSITTKPTDSPIESTT